jgi:hypothetical protein
MIIAWLLGLGVGVFLTWCVMDSIRDREWWMENG